MSNLTRFDPFRDLWPDLAGRWPTTLRMPEGMPSEIKLDVSESPTAYTVKAEIPGAKKEDIHVNVEGNVVSIQAHREQKTEKKEGERVLLRELVSGSVSRSFSLSHEIEDREVVAKLEDGVLNLTLPKRRGGAAKRIEVL